MATETYRWLFVGTLALFALAVIEYFVEMAVRAWLAARRAEREDAEWRDGGI
jgi:hypothetical protein